MNRKIIYMLIFYAILSFALNFQHAVTPTYLIEIGYKGDLYGVLFALMALGISLASPIAGRLGDKIGTKIPIFFGLIGYAIAQILLGSFSSIYILVFVRLLAGVSIAFVLTNTMGYITKNSSKDTRGKIMSIYVGLQLLFVAVAYKVGGVLGLMMPVRYVFYLQGLLIIILGIISLMIPNCLVGANSKENIDYKRLLSPKHVKILTVYFLVIMSFIVITRFLELYIIELGHSTKDLGDFMFITGIISIVATLIVLPILSNFFKELTILRVALVIAAIAVVITFNMFDNVLNGLYSVYLLFVAAHASYNPMHNSYISKLNEEHQGQIIGISQSVMGIAMFIGPILGGLIYANNPIMMFNISAIILIIALFILITQKGDFNES